MVQKSGEGFRVNGKYSRVVTNPGQEKNLSIEGRYPDIIAVGHDGYVKVIEEVETEDSVNEEESQQWADFAKLGIPSFHLAVPKEKVQKAGALLRQRGIREKVHLEGYRIVGDRLEWNTYTPKK